MVGRIVEIADDRRHLSVYRGFMIVKDTENDRSILGKVPLDGISAVVTHAHGLSYTNNLLVELAKRGIPFVLCGANHNPVGMLLSIDGNYEQSRRIEAQYKAKIPLMKQVWAAIVKSKLEQQAAVLEAVGEPHIPLLSLSKKVRSGDPSNIEAQGARRYWTLLFGRNFRRDKNADGINSLLNYGYTILRSATARSVIASGLHPSIGVFHSNAGNPMRLVDDLIEPFRPLIDIKVWFLNKKDEIQVTPETKRLLVNSLYDDMNTDLGVTPVITCIENLAISLAQVYLGQRKQIDLPYRNLPLSISAYLADID